jgi:hypothetical protein
VGNGDETIWRLLVERRDLSPEVIEKLALVANWRVRLEVSKRPDLPPAAMKRLVGDRSIRVVRALAQNTNCLPEVVVLAERRLAAYDQRRIQQDCG